VFRLLIGIVVAATVLSACQRDRESMVQVTVTDSTGVAVPDAVVRLSGQPSDTIYVNKLTLYDLEQTTTASGIALFTFTEFYQQGPDGFAILKVDVTSGVGTGHSLVKLTEGETSRVTVTVQ
jgi:hypothetical protein